MVYMRAAGWIFIGIIIVIMGWIIVVALQPPRPSVHAQALTLIHTTNYCVVAIAHTSDQHMQTAGVVSLALQSQEGICSSSAKTLTSLSSTDATSLMPAIQQAQQTINAALAMTIDEQASLTAQGDILTSLDVQRDSQSYLTALHAFLTTIAHIGGTSAPPSF